MTRNEWKRMRKWLLRFLLAEFVLVILFLWGCVYYVTLASSKVSTEPEIITVVKTVPIEAQQSEPPLVVEQEPEEIGEDENEAEKITEALLESGYYRDDVPLSYELQDVLHTVCEREGVEYEVVLGPIELESNFNEDALNQVSGCFGLFQLNPKYFPYPLTTEENIDLGVSYLGEQLLQYDGDIEAALTAYNAGYDTGNRSYANSVLEKADGWRKQNEE